MTEIRTGEFQRHMTEYCRKFERYSINLLNYSLRLLCVHETKHYLIIDLKPDSIVTQLISLYKY